MGYVYILSNPSMQGMVKIGSTDRNPAERASELSATTGVPTPFHIELAVFFKNHATMEFALHDELASARVRGGREFFRISIEDACICLRLRQLAALIEEVTGLDERSRTSLFCVLQEAYPTHPFFKSKIELEINTITAVLLHMPDDMLTSTFENVIRKRPIVWKNIR